jgi:ribosomal protein S18 acetylase RimI-like enzyme
MPEINIRPVNSSDIPSLKVLDHNYTSDNVWQMEIQAEEERINVGFRHLRLPRSVRVEYPRSPHTLVDDWKLRSGLLVATLEDEIVGYISVMQNIAPTTTWVTDLAVLRRVRRQGIGSALVLAAQEWAVQHNTFRIVLEMQPKNYPAICLAQKLGFEFCGFHDHYYANHDIALFFSKSLPWERPPLIDF